MRALLAINYPQLVEQLERYSSLEVTPASDVCYLDAVKEAVLTDKPDILILSAFLHGFDLQKCCDAVLAARENSVRVILLAGSLEKDDPLLFEMVKLGVYDILFNPCSLDRILNLIKNPATFSDVSHYFKRPVSSVGTRIALPGEHRRGMGKSEGGGNLIGKIKARLAGEPLGQGFAENSDVKSGISTAPVQDDLPAPGSGNVDEADGVLVEDGNAEMEETEGSVEEPKVDEVAEHEVEAVEPEPVKQPVGGTVGGTVVSIQPVAKRDVLVQEERFEKNRHAGVSAPRSRLEGMSGKKGVVVACWSPVPAGKTFVAVNLAVAASKMGKKVTLLDLDFARCAVYVWLNITGQPDSICRLLDGDPAGCASYGDMDVYGADPAYRFNGADPAPGMGEILDRIEKRSLVVLDMPRDLTPWHEGLLGECDYVVMVADPDCTNYESINREIARFGNAVLVVNKHVELGVPFSYKDLFGAEPVVEIPLLGDVYRSILFGRPLVGENANLMRRFKVLCQKINPSRKGVLSGIAR